MKRYLFLFILFFLISNKGFGQQFFACNSDGLLIMVSINGNNITYVPIEGCGDYEYFSIAILGSKFYYNNMYGDLFSADIVPGIYPSINNCKLIATGVTGNALTIDLDGILFYANGNQLYSINPNSTNPIPNLLGVMPYYAAGDLAFFNNELYMASSYGIINVNLADPSKSSLYISIPGQLILGLATAILNGKNTLYALSLVGNGTNLIQLDMLNKKVVGNPIYLPETVYDAASETESGIVKTVDIASSSLTQECNAFNKAQVNIVCKPDSNKYTFQLNSAQTNNTGVFTDLSPGTYQLNITSSGGEIPKDTTFTVPDYTLNNPTITATLKNPVCDIKGLIKLDAGNLDPLYTVQYNGVSYGFDHVFTNLSAGNYQFTILNLNGCIIDEKNYSLQQDICPPITIENIQVNAECDEFGQASLNVITAAHPDNYVYTLNNISDTTGVFDDFKPGTYNLVITSSGGDRVEQQVIVPDFTLNKPAIAYTVKNAVCSLPGEVTFTITGNSNGASQIRCGTALFPIGQPVKNVIAGTNYFSVLNQQGCVIDTLDVNVPKDECNPVVFPNTFTPNGDNINDIFRPNQDADPFKYKLLIFSRWGKLIFQSFSIFNGWKGDYNGKPLPVGVYYWVVTYTNADGKDIKQSGNVTLLR